MNGPLCQKRSSHQGCRLKKRSR